MGIHFHLQHTALFSYWYTIGGEPPNDDIDGATKLTGIPTHAYLTSILTWRTDGATKHYGLCVLYFWHDADDIRSIDLSHITNEHLNTQRRAAYHKKKVQDNVLLQEVQQPCLSKSGKLFNCRLLLSHSTMCSCGIQDLDLFSFILCQCDLHEFLNIIELHALTVFIH